MPSRQRRGEIVGHADVFALDLHRALVEQLPEALDQLTPMSLTQANLAVLGNERGVYQLFEGGRSVYVGKSEDPLATRLEQHRRRCSGRLNIDVRRMAFRCLYVDRFVDAASPERVLIDKYKAEGLAPWNGSNGFAPKDVGRHRDHTKPGAWFLEHPADYRALVTVPSEGRPIPLLSALEKIKDAVAFDLFRFASSRSRDPADRADAARDYPNRSVSLPVGSVPLLVHVRAVIEQLPAKWQATVLPHGVIIYKEKQPHYDYAFDGWRRTDVGVEPVPRGLRAP